MYVNRKTKEKISDAVYRQMAIEHKGNWTYVDPTSEDDYIDYSFLTSAAIAAITDSAILGGLLGGNWGGAIFGDFLDGDLFD